MAKGKRTGKGHDARYAAYKNGKVQAANRKRKLERALKKNPENTQIEPALKSIVYRRKTPTTPYWSATRRQIAGLFKEFTGSVNMDIFSSKEKIAAAAVMTPGHISVLRFPKVNENAMFKLATRLSTSGFSSLNI